MKLSLVSTTFSCFALALLCVGIDKCAVSDDGGTDKPGTTSQQPTHAPKPKAYVGINIADLHPALAAHISSLGNTSQGVIVESVYPQSPAANAGIREHDILLTYGDQKLFSRDQLFKLIANDQPGREISFRLIREGKEELATITLGERPANWAPPLQLPDRRFQVSPQFEWPPRLRHGPAGIARMNSLRPTWHQIESITVKWLEKDRFRATLTHFDKDGKLEKHEYEGTRDELRKLIDADDDLRPNERHHLFRTLDIEDHPNPWEMFRDGSDSGF